MSAVCLCYLTTPHRIRRRSWGCPSPPNPQRRLHEGPAHAHSRVAARPPAIVPCDSVIAAPLAAGLHRAGCSCLIPGGPPTQRHDFGQPVLRGSRLTARNWQDSDLSLRSAAQHKTATQPPAPHPLPRQSKAPGRMRCCRTMLLVCLSKSPKIGC